LKCYDVGTKNEINQIFGRYFMFCVIKLVM